MYRELTDFLLLRNNYQFEKLKNHILEVVYLTINCLTKKRKQIKERIFLAKYPFFLSPDPSVFVLAAEKPPLLYRGTPHLDQIDSHQFGLVLFQHAFFAVYPAYPTTNGCRFRHRIIYPFFAPVLVFPSSFVFLSSLPIFV